MNALPEIMPYAALAGAALALVALIAFAVKRARIHRRPLLFAGVVLGAAPLLYVTLVWARLVPEAYVRFARPELAPIVFGALAFVALRLAFHGVRWSRVRVVLADLTIVAAALASAVAAMGPELGRPLDRLAIVVVVDRSRSIDLVPNAEQRVQRELTVAEESMRDDDFLGTVVFASDAATEQPLRQKGTAPSVQRVDLGRDGTDIAAGLRRALAEVPADAAARLVIMSDGVPTRGDVMSAAAAAVASEIPVDTVVLEQRSIADVRVVSFRVTPRASEGETIGMRVVTSSPKETEIEVRIKQNGKLVTRSRAKIAAGEDVLVLRDKAPESGLHRYDVEITALDKALDETAEDNAASAFMRVSGPARALVLDGEAGKTAFIAGALAEAGFRVEEGAHSALAPDIDGMAGYDLIVMGDIPAHELSTRQIEALASYVRDLGGGLVLTGGDRSMGPGGYSRTPIEEVSPVSFDLKQERRRASLAEVIAIDISGSMGMTVGSHTKLELANEAAARSAALLGSGDYLGVVHVDTEAHWSLPLQPVKDKEAIDKAIRNQGPGGGGILCDIALQEAYAALRGASVNLKHVLLFADGADAENITPAVKGWTSTAMSDGITTSVVALGQGPFLTDLEELSRRGSGRFYIVEDATRLPAIFAQETVLASRSAIVEKTFSVAKASSGAITQGIDFSAAPPLAGYVVTIPKGRSSVLLTGLEGDPILAVWPAGLGRAAAFTSDLKDRWGSAWTSWQGAARMVAQMARDVARSEDDRRVRLEADASGGQLHLRATVVDDDGRLQSFRRLRAGVQGPDGFARDVPLEAAGAGSYTATVPLARPGAYIAVARDEVSGDAVATTGAALSAGEEMRPTGSDRGLLARIAELTGGKERDTLAGIFHDRSGRRFAYRDVTLPLLLVAAFGLLLAVAARRLSIPEGAYSWMRRLRDYRPAAREAEGAPGGKTAQATLDTLLTRKQTARPEPAAGEPQSSAEPPSPAEPPPQPLRPPPVRRDAPRIPVVRTPPPAEDRQRSAAEILLERRKRRGPGGQG